MIHVKRGPQPAILRASVAKKARKAANTAFAVPAEKRAQQDFDFARHLQPLLGPCRDALMKQFARKCAYCEMPIDPKSGGHIDWFRPRGGVSETSGGFLPDHYRGQAFEWANLYLACPVCNRNKSNRFPIETGSTRASADANRIELAAERPMLLDPCDHRPGNDPALHLVFTADGLVSGATERGRQTIEILALNRGDLVKERALHAQEFLRVFADGIEGPATRALLAAEQPYLALKRQLREARLAPPRGATKRREKAARAAQTTFDTARDEVATEKSKGLENYRARARYIEGVLIENIASIEKLMLDLKASQSQRTPCFALLGTNGVGKSTVLKAIALALAGPAYVKRLGLKAGDLLRDGAARGRVMVWVGGYSHPVEMTLKRAGGSITFKQQGSRALVLGYGSSRLLPTTRHRPKAGMSHAKIDNLFDPFLPLTDAEAWLDAVPAARFSDAARSMRALLPVEDGAELVPRTKGQPITVRFMEDAPRKLRELSDGYQSMLGLAADILEIMYKQGFESARAAQGVVLIDELGNHLHPAWRLRIVAALRDAFPQVQFVYSTHDPLCLRGLDDGEVAVLRRDAKRYVYALEDLPPVAGLRVDQLLTSEHFGLDSTVDPDTDRDMKRYRELLAQPTRVAAQETELGELRQRLTEVRLLGATQRERLLLEALDAEAALAQALPKQPSVSARELDQATVLRLQQVMRSIGTGAHAAPKKVPAKRAGP